MFQPGEYVFYGRTGVCCVDGIEENNGKKFYRLTPMYQQCSILTPVGGKTYLRPILRRAEVDALIDRLPTLEAKPVDAKAQRELMTCYQNAISIPDTEKLALLSMSIYLKKQSLLQEKRKLGAIDERFLREAESLLFGELAAALDIAPGDVPGYIQARLEKSGHS